jgi:hypothetical protein
MEDILKKIAALQAQRHAAKQSSMSELYNTEDVAVPREQLVDYANRRSATTEQNFNHLGHIINEDQNTDPYLEDLHKQNAADVLQDSKLKELLHNPRLEAIKKLSGR